MGARRSSRVGDRLEAAMRRRPRRTIRRRLAIAVLAAAAGSIGAVAIIHTFGGGSGQERGVTAAAPPAPRAEVPSAPSPQISQPQAPSTATATEPAPAPAPASAAPVSASPTEATPASAAPAASPGAAKARPVGSAAWPAGLVAEATPASGREVVTRVGEATPPPPPGPLEISDVRLVYVSASAARISWHTNLPTLGRAVYGIDEPTVWAPADVPGLDHEAVLGGLAFSKTYDVSVRALDDWGRVAAADLELTTQPLGERQTAESRSGAILVDGQPVFPLMVWHLCSDGYAKHIADGINLFMGDDCDETSMPELLDGRAYSLVANTNSELDGPGVLGWYYRDEWDAFLPSNVSQADLQKELVPPKPGRLSFLTLTNHFYSHADPLPQGKGMYPTLATVSDALGFDLYPLQVWCRPSFGHVFESQREIQQLASGKPTFQWIETAPMEHPCRNDHRLDPNPATVRAETWLAVAGGASGIGYFPNHWKRDIGEEIAQTNRRLTSLAPVLIGPSSVASTDAGAVNVGVRQLNDALYVIAVNTSAEKVDAKISVKDLRGRGLTVLGEARTVSATDDTFSDTFEPLAVHVYVVGPDGWPVQS